MVSFICDACGNTVKKTQVEKHYSTECRNCSVLSCLDCGKDFPGDSYIKHTSCVTEAEKYQGHLYQAKDKENKGETKQKEWLKNVHGVTSSANSPKLNNLLKRLSAYSNIPRKKKKFDNFCRNSVNVRDAKTLDQLWDLFNVSSPESNAKDECCENKDEDKAKVTESTNCDESAQMLNGSECLSDADVQPSLNGKKKRKNPGEEEDTENAVEDADINEEPVRKMKKKKKKKHLSDGGTICNGESHNTQINNSDEISAESELGNETTTKSKKKKRKHEQVNVECDIGSGDAKYDDGTNKSQENKKKKKVKKRKLEVETNGGDIEVEMTKRDNVNIEGGEKENEDEETKTAQNVKFNWHKTIKTILKGSEDHELSLKKLRRKVLNAYQEHGIDHRAPTIDESRALFEKKLKTYPKVKILNDSVKLVK